MESETHDGESRERTPAEIEAEIGRQVVAVNDALAMVGAVECCLWSYSVSHCTLEVLIGDALARGGNLVVVMSGCIEIAGPMRWKSQKLRVAYERSKGGEDGTTYVLFDDAVKFRAVSGVLGFRRNYDLLEHGSVAFPRKGTGEGN